MSVIKGFLAVIIACSVSYGATKFTEVKFTETLVIISIYGGIETVCRGFVTGFVSGLLNGVKKDHPNYFED